MRKCDLFKCYSHWSEMDNDYVNEAVKTVAEKHWNAEDWKGCSGDKHLCNMLNGWLGELVVKYNFPNLEYYGEDHDFMDLDRPTKDMGKPDLIDKETGETVEVKAFGNPYRGLIGKKVNALHGANHVYIVDKYRNTIYEATDIILDDNFNGKEGLYIISYNLKFLKKNRTITEWCSVEDNTRIKIEVR